MEREQKMEFDLTAINKEADILLQGPESKDWLSIAKFAKISQVEFVNAPETICFLTHTPEPYSLLTRSSISTFTGKAKAGKTSVLAVLIAPTLSSKKVLWIDTEQGKYYASRTQFYILSTAGLKHCSNLEMYDLRPYGPSDRMKIIEALLQHAAYDLVILDGIRDVVLDINNPEQATMAITTFMKWSVDYNCHIAMVLHQNKGSNNEVRGHLGTEAVNKSEIVIAVNKIDDGCGTIVVSAQDSRSIPFNDFYIKRIDHGVPVIDVEYTPPEQTAGRKKLSDPIEFPDSRHIEILNVVFSNNDGLSSGDFYSGLTSAWTSLGGENMALTRAKTFRSYYVQKGFIIQKSNQKGNKTINTLNEKHRVGSLVNQLSNPTV